MTISTNLIGRSPIAWLAASGNKFMPQIVFEAEGGGGGGDDEAAAKAAAEAKAKEETDAKAKADAEAKAKEEAEKNKNKPSDKEAELLKDLMKQKEARKKADDAVKAAEEKLKRFEGIDPEEIQKLLNEKKDAERAALEAKGDFERVKQMMRDEHTKEVEKLKKGSEDTVAKLNEALSRIDELTVGSAFANSNFVKEDLILTPAKARVIYGSNFEMVDGELVAFDKPRGSANRTKLVNAAGDPLSFDEALKKLVEADGDKDTILKSKMKGGMGGKPGDKGKVPPTNDADGVKGLSRIQAALNAAAKK